MRRSLDTSLSRIRRSGPPDATIEAGVSGQVKWFSRHRGYGFIDINQEFEVFVHFSSIEGQGYRILEKGDRVTFDLVKGPHGYQAVNVKFRAA